MDYGKMFVKHLKKCGYNYEDDGDIIVELVNDAVKSMKKTKEDSFWIETGNIHISVEDWGNKIYVELLRNEMIKGLLSNGTNLYLNSDKANKKSREDKGN
jgi:hypothetical protein